MRLMPSRAYRAAGLRSVLMPPKTRVLQRIDLTIEGIEIAMQKGAAISRANAVEFEQINTALSATTRKLDEIRGRLVAVMENMGTSIG